MRKELFISPLKVHKSKEKFFILNLNNYRNAHHQVLAKTKREYGDEMYEPVSSCKPFSGLLCVHYTIYPKTKRTTDIGNVVAIHKKYFEDVLVSHKLIDDDDYKTIVFNSESFGGVDNKNPRVEVSVFSYDNPSELLSSHTDNIKSFLLNLI